MKQGLIRIAKRIGRGLESVVTADAAAMFWATPGFYGDCPWPELGYLVQRQAGTRVSPLSVE